MSKVPLYCEACTGKGAAGKHVVKRVYAGALCVDQNVDWKALLRSIGRREDIQKNKNMDSASEEKRIPVNSRSSVKNPVHILVYNFCYK